MKLFKILALALTSISLVACGSDDDSSTPAPELTVESLQGNYEMTALTINTTRVLDEGGGVMTDLDPRSETADRIEDVILTLSSNDTFTITGSYIRETLLDGEIDEDANTIGQIDDAGTYSINIENQTINFVSDNTEDADDVFLSGMYTISSIEDTSNLNIFQQAESLNVNIATTTESTLEFERILEEE